MADPRAVLAHAREGPAPSGWRVFTKKRGKVSGFLRGTSDDPDPLLVITPEVVVEYKDDHKPLSVVTFSDLAEAALKADATTSSTSSFATLDVWVELIHLDGRKEKWRSKSFSSNLQPIQAFIEAYGVHKALQEAGGR
ncbi:hypothetical protein [Streptomyces fragilis]|uniref:Uncharacterized protein n=1 Tax=Streptomyces fragilis TaxID=67301 RepID=A0ABV2YLW5_9ACTN|nr:hypothetical protein [Streptomyces fragilis]